MADECATEPDGTSEQRERFDSACETARSLADKGLGEKDIQKNLEKQGLSSSGARYITNRVVR